MSLIDTSWLEKNIDKVKIIDCSWHMPQTQRNGFEEYCKEHIPNAIFFDLDKNSKLDTDLPHMLTDSISWEKIMSRAQKINKVIKGLKKASKTHASQAKTLESVKLKKGGKTKSRVNEAGNYTKPGLRKRIFNRIKAGGKGGKPGQWSARKAQMMAKAYKKAGGGYK